MEKNRKEITPLENDIVIRIRRDSKQVVILKEWARKNFEPHNTEIQDHWHPIVIEECEIMIFENDEFLFENYKDTDLSKPSMGVMIMGIIDETHEIILKKIQDNDTKSNDAVHEISKLWINAIEYWKQQSDKMSS